MPGKSSRRFTLVPPLYVEPARPVSSPSSPREAFLGEDRVSRLLSRLALRLRCILRMSPQPEEVLLASALGARPVIRQPVERLSGIDLAAARIESSRLEDVAAHSASPSRCSSMVSLVWHRPALRLTRSGARTCPFRHRTAGRPTPPECSQKAFPEITPAVGSPSAGSYTYPHTVHTHFFMASPFGCSFDTRCTSAARRHRGCPPDRPTRRRASA